MDCVLETRAALTDTHKLVHGLLDDINRFVGISSSGRKIDGEFFKFLRTMRTAGRRAAGAVELVGSVFGQLPCNGNRRSPIIGFFHVFGHFLRSLLMWFSWQVEGRKRFCKYSSLLELSAVLLLTHNQPYNECGGGGNFQTFRDFWPECHVAPSPHVSKVKLSLHGTAVIRPRLASPLLLFPPSLGRLLFSVDFRSGWMSLIQSDDGTDRSSFSAATIQSPALKRARSEWLIGFSSALLLLFLSGEVTGRLL